MANSPGDNRQAGYATIPAILAAAFLSSMTIGGGAMLEKQNLSLFCLYPGYSIVAVKDVYYHKDEFQNQLNFKGKFYVISNIPTEYSDGTTKMVLAKDDGSFVELSDGKGGELQHWQIGNFNWDDKLDIAVTYGYTGSGGFGDVYLQELSGDKVKTLFYKMDAGNDFELKDLDSDGISEFIYHFYPEKWGLENQAIFKLNQDKLKQVYLR